MADSKKYYYIRLKDDFFDEDVIKILESMPDGYLYCNILLKLYLKSLKFNGCLMYNERIPYNPTVLATLTRHSVGTVEKALEIFKQLELIDILDNGAIYMLDIQNYIGKTSTEADRKREYRTRIEQEKLSLLENGQMSGQMSGQTPPEIRDKNIDIKDKSIEIREERGDTVLFGTSQRQPEDSIGEVRVVKEKIDYQLIADLYNDTCVSFPRLKTLSDSRKKAIKARLKTYTVDDFKELFKKAESSNFLKGSNDRNWSANFDWLIKDSNMAKVLEGCYDNKQNKSGKRKEAVPSWMMKEQHDYDFEQIEKDLMANSPELQQRAEELRERLNK